MRITITILTNTSAFDRPDPEAEVGHLLRRTADYLASESELIPDGLPYRDENLVDSDGNDCGVLRIEPDSLPVKAGESREF